MRRGSVITSPHRNALAPRASCGYSLIEVAIVLVIIGVIGAIAIPRLSRGSQGSADAATVQSAAVLQKALDLYAAEHAGAYPAPDQITDQLTLYTDIFGGVSKKKTIPFDFGPYLRKVPAIPTGPNKGKTAIATTAGSGVAWVYNPQDGTITPNLSRSVADGGDVVIGAPAETLPGGPILLPPPTTLPVLPF